MDTRSRTSSKTSLLDVLKSMLPTPTSKECPVIGPNRRLNVKPSSPLLTLTKTELNKKALEHMTRHDEELRAELLADLKEAFSIYDRNGDGVISAKELTKVMRSMGLNPTEGDIMEIMVELDIDGDGVIQFPEFINMMMQRIQTMDTADEIKKVFQVFDRDGNGFIQAEELKYMMVHVLQQEITDSEVDDLFKEADIDGDGRLNYDEFVRMLVSD